MIDYNGKRRSRSNRLLLTGIVVGLILLTIGSANRAAAVGARNNAVSVHNGAGFEWVNANPVGATPSARSGHRMVYDESRSKVVLFGGMDTQNNFLNDIWEWDTASTTWTNVTPTSGSMPIPRANFGMAYDVANGIVLIYGGDISTQFSNVGMTGDTWEWKGNTRTWTEKPASTIVFVGLWGAELAYDPNLQKVILFGGSPYWGWPENPSTFVWDGSNWNLASSSGPIGRVRHAMATDVSRSKVVLFGGHHRLESGSSIRLQDTWEWNGSGWLLVSPQVSPPVSYGAAMAYDTTREVMLLFGGAAPFVQDTWEWDGANWTLRLMQGSPSPRWSAVAYDSSNSTLVLFGGNATVLPTVASSQTPSGQSSLGETYLFVSDNAPPTTTATLSSAENGAGWHNSDVTVVLDALDHHLGSGVKEITYSATGAQMISPTTVSDANTNLLITAEGETTITYFASDVAGNTETAQTLIVRIDKSAPSVSCGSADGAWHANDVSISCTANDSTSGLIDSDDSSFNLTTNVPANTETANASTDSRTICDVAANCATAGPVGGNKVDKRPPGITVTTPSADAVYLLNQSVAASYTCTDGGSGVTSCAGPVASGSNIDTATVGAKTFVVTTSDNVGNNSTPESVSYAVSYGIHVLFDQNRAVKSGSTIPIKIQIVDVNSNNMSTSAVVVHAVSVLQTSTDASVMLDDAGEANPDFDFRYDSSLDGTGGYIFNLKTSGYTTGSYLLYFSVGGDPKLHSVQFQVRQ